MSQARDPECPCCGKRQFEFLNRPPADSAALCGQDAVQIRAPATTKLDLAALARKLSTAGQVQARPFMVRLLPHEHPGLRLTVFADGRLIVQGTQDVAAARSIYARVIGS